MAAGLLKIIAESFVSKVLEKLVDCGLKRAGKDSKFKLETLHRRLNSLSDKAWDINEQIRHGEQLGKKKRKREVENWLKEVQKIESELGVLQNQVQEEGFLSRFFGEDRVSEFNERVHELIDESHHFGELLHDASEMKGEPLMLTSLFRGEAFEKNIGLIWKWLVIDKVKSIGIYGMGGVGKTTSAKHIHNRLLKETQLSVYWITVPQWFTINKLQSDIAKVIGRDLSDEENEDKRAARLNQALSQKEFVLILDDLWSDIDLEKMGDPLGVEGCRLIVTSRSLRVCQRIDCREIIKLETLKTDESWTLFRQTLGERMAITSEVEEIAKSLAKKCDGLPLGIIVLAKSMKGVTDIHEWRNVDDEIRESSMELDDMKYKVFRVLKYSFNRLDPEFYVKRRRRNGYTNLQLCFLYCCLYPEDFTIVKYDLVKRFISEELVDTRKSLEKQLDQGYTMLSKLVDLCLLESPGDDPECVMMHDLVRDMALSIARESPKYKVFAGLSLEEMPNEEEWTEDVDKMSLMINDVVEIPPGLTPNCPKLATLLLHNNPLLRSIPESFFAKMSGLRILDLSDTSIRELPNSLSDLESLNTLLLNDCKDLVSLPFMGKLKALRELDLSRTSITRLPDSLSDLESLNTLLLSNCKDLVSLPFMGKLKKLRELNLSHTSITRLPDSLSDLESLDTLHLYNFKDLVSLPFMGKLKKLRELDLSYTSITRLPDSLSDLESLKTLLLKNCKDLVSLPFMGKLKALRELDLSYTSITRLPDSLSNLESLNTLLLSNCKDLVSLPFMGKLKALRGLNLSHTSIREIPKGVENLINLEILLFRGTKYLKLQPGDLPIKSRNLQLLEFPLEIEVPVHEIVESFKQLNTFVGRFKDISDFNWFQSQTGGLISKFSYVVGNTFDEYDEFEECGNSNKLWMEGCSLRREGGDGAIILPEKVPKLIIKRCKGLSSWVLEDLCSSSVIEELIIDDCEGIESIWNINDQLMAETRVNVANLELYHLPDLKCLVNWEEGGLRRLPQAVMIFSSLKYLNIYGCDKMKTLGLPLRCIRNITNIQVVSCGEIEELIELDEDYEEISEPTHSLPNLKRLCLSELPKLKSICKARIDCKSIEEIEIWDCPRVKKLPLFLPSTSDGGVINYSPPPALKHIKIEEESWESLEWDDDIRHKHLLQPFVRFE